MLRKQLESSSPRSRAETYEFDSTATLGNESLWEATGVLQLAFAEGSLTSGLVRLAKEQPSLFEHAYRIICVDVSYAFYSPDSPQVEESRADVRQQARARAFEHEFQCHELEQRQSWE
jgi:hypothetical protein